MVICILYFLKIIDLTLLNFAHCACRVCLKRNYSFPVIIDIGRAKYWDEHVCISVYLCVCLSAGISADLRQVFVHVAYCRGSTFFLWRRCDTGLRFPGFLNDVQFSALKGVCSTCGFDTEAYIHTELPTGGSVRFLRLPCCMIAAGVLQLFVHRAVER